MQDSNKSEEEIANLKMQEDLHLEQAKKARDAYNENRLVVALEDQKTVISFAYSENISVPNLLTTPAIFYFKTRRKIELFGVKSDSKCNILQLFWRIHEIYRFYLAL